MAILVTTMLGFLHVRTATRRRCSFLRPGKGTVSSRESTSLRSNTRASYDACPPLWRSHEPCRLEALRLQCVDRAVLGARARGLRSRPIRPSRARPRWAISPESRRRVSAAMCAPPCKQFASPAGRGARGLGGSRAGERAFIGAFARRPVYRRSRGVA